jgi:hypothetical protein
MILHQFNSMIDPRFGYSACATPPLNQLSSIVRQGGLIQINEGRRSRRPAA